MQNPYRYRLFRKLTQTNRDRVQSVRKIGWNIRGDPSACVARKEEESNFDNEEGGADRGTDRGSYANSSRQNWQETRDA